MTREDWDAAIEDYFDQHTYLGPGTVIARVRDLFAPPPPPPPPPPRHGTAFQLAAVRQTLAKTPPATTTG